MASAAVLLLVVGAVEGEVIGAYSCSGRVSASGFGAAAACGRHGPCVCTGILRWLLQQ